MIIEKIHIDCFGNLEECDIQLGDGVNIIEGANESGKSTVAAFIKFIFYGLSGKLRDTKLSERDRYINWHTGNAGGHIIVRTENARFRIERTLIIAGQKLDGGEIRKSYREGMQIIDLANNSPVSGISSPGEYFFGVDEDIFARTAFVSQAGGAKVDADKLTESIENILFSASENVNISKALKKLDASRVALLHKNGAGGQIHELEVKCARLEEKLEEAKKNSSDILEKESSLRDAKAKFEETNLKAERLKKEISGFENKTVSVLFDNLHILEAKKEKCTNEKSELLAKYTVNGILPSEDYISELEGSIKKLNEAKAKAADILSELENAKRDISAGSSTNDIGDESLGNKNDAEKKDSYAKALLSLEKFKQRAHSSALMAAIFASIAFVFIICGTASVHFSFFAEIGKILLFSSIFPLIFALLFFVHRSGTQAAKRRYLKKFGVSDEEEFALLVKSEEEKQKTAALQNDKLRALEAKYKQALEALGNAEIELARADIWKAHASAEENLSEARAIVNELGKNTAESEKLDGMLEMLVTQLGQYNEEEVRKNADNGTEASDIDETNISAKRREYEFLSKAADALKVRIHELEKSLAALYPQADNPSRIAEKIELAHSFISEYRKKHAAYLLAAEKLEEASASMRDNISPKLADFTSKLVSELTHGKYSEIGIDSELKVSVRTEAGTREPAYLSAGTQDITYVCLRLALINTLFRKGIPPVIFAESFARLDNERLSQVLKLSYMTRFTMQSILLTSSSRDAQLMSMIGDYKHIKLG